MKSLLEARSIGESVTWSCEFARLYFVYRLQSSELTTPNYLDCTRANFDSFLYSKISNLREWEECISNYETSKPSSEWCSAWIRIMLNFKNNQSLVKFDKTKEFFKDRESVIRWLTEKIVIANGTMKFKATYEQTKPQDEAKVVNLVCYKLVNNVSSPSCLNYCRASGSRISTSLLSEDSTIQCQCPRTKNFNDVFSGLILRTLESIFFWSGGESKFNICGKNSTHRNSTRCEDLR